MTREFVEQWKQRHPSDTVTYRDIGCNPIPHVDESWIAAAFSSPEQHMTELREAIRLSD
jgi:FMN-dependent NADH-azoreductase